jgi:LuxR family transcriptional regulator, maltose regulon positive regulatory protein
MDHVPGDRGHRVPEELSEFLLRTSVADVLDAELCEALSGRSGSADVLRRMEADLQFVMATGPGRDTYRYHPLLAKMLRSELETHRDAILSHAELGVMNWMMSVAAEPSGRHSPG